MKFDTQERNMASVFQTHLITSFLSFFFFLSALKDFFFFNVLGNDSSLYLDCKKTRTMNLPFKTREPEI